MANMLPSHRIVTQHSGCLSAYCRAQTFHLLQHSTGRQQSRTAWARRRRHSLCAFADAFGDGMYSLTQQVDGLVEQQLRGKCLSLQAS